MQNETEKSKERVENEENDHFCWRNPERYHRIRNTCIIYSVTLLCDFPACIDSSLCNSNLTIAVLNKYCWVTSSHYFLCASLFFPGLF